MGLKATGCFGSENGWKGVYLDELVNLESPLFDKQEKGRHCSSLDKLIR